MCERYGVPPKGDVVASVADERFNDAFGWGVPTEAAPVDDELATTHAQDLAAELAAFDRYQRPRGEAAA
jgi:hypothetical protein